MYKKEIGVRAQKLLTNLGSIVNIIPGAPMGSFSVLEE